MKTDSLKVFCAVLTSSGAVRNFSKNMCVVCILGLRREVDLHSCRC